MSRFSWYEPGPLKSEVSMASQLPSCSQPRASTGPSSPIRSFAQRPSSYGRDRPRRRFRTRTVNRRETSLPPAARETALRWRLAARPSALPDSRSRRSQDREGGRRRAAPCRAKIGGHARRPGSPLQDQCRTTAEAQPPRVRAHPCRPKTNHLAPGAPRGRERPDRGATPTLAAQHGTITGLGSATLTRNSDRSAIRSTRPRAR
jgi:hypothetical protein